MNKPIFLISSERSGSNLIRSMLGSHSHIWAPMPMHLLQTILIHLPEYGSLQKEKNWELLIKHVCQIIEYQIGEIGFEIKENEIFENVKNRDFWGIFNYIYNKGLNVNSKSRLFFKENHSYQFVSSLLYNFPDAKFIVQVRDPRDFTLSMIKRDEKINDIFLASSIWEKDQFEALQLAKILPEKVHVHTYEGLLNQPEFVLKNICDFIGLEYDGNMLEFNKNVGENAAKHSKSWENLNKALINDNKKKYKEELSDLEINLIEYQLGKLMENFGYSKEFNNVTNRKLIHYLHKLGNSPFRKYISKLLPNHSKVEMDREEKEKREEYSNIRKTMKDELQQIENKRLVLDN